MRFGLLIVLLGVGIWSGSASGATVGPARDAPTHKVLLGVKVEGEIERGDTVKLLNEVMQFDIIYSPEVARIVFLRSKGGDVEEAMKMGTLIRRLRLSTDVPMKHGDELFPSMVLLADENNNVCASACFLVYAGGVERHGNFLALHWPYLPKEATSKLPDFEYETAQKQEMAKVRAYLQSMDIDQLLIDKMMATNSQDSFVLTLGDTITYNLDAIVPSIEEIVLAKCNVLTAQERRTFESTNNATPEGRRIRERLFAKLAAYWNCEPKVLDDIRREAFKREMEALTVSTESYKREMEALTVPGPEPPLTGEQAHVRGLMLEGIKALARDDKAEASRWFQQAADAGGPKVMIAIAGFHIGQRDDAEAVRWYEEAADGGDAEAMLRLGGMYIWDPSLGKNCGTARYWYEKAAAAGNDDAKDFLRPGTFDKLCPQAGLVTPPKPTVDELLGPPPKQ